MGIFAKMDEERRNNEALAKKLEFETTERVAIPFEVVEKIFELYCLDYSLSAIAKELKINYATVSKYVNHGDSSREIQPLQQRKADVYKRAMEEKNGEMVLKLRQIMNTASDVVETTGKRFIDRVQAAKELEDPSLYDDGMRSVRQATEAKAYNPDSKDLARVLGAATEILKTGGSMFESSSPSLHINASSQANAASQIVSQGPIEVILEHLEGVREQQTETKNINVVADIIKKISLKSEEEVKGK